MVPVCDTEGPRGGASLGWHVWSHALPNIGGFKVPGRDLCPWPAVFDPTGVATACLELATHCPEHGPESVLRSPPASLFPHSSTLWGPTCTPPIQSRRGRHGFGVPLQASGQALRGCPHPFRTPEAATVCPPRTIHLAASRWTVFGCCSPCTPIHSLTWVSTVGTPHN